MAAELASINREITGLALDPAPEAVRSPSGLRTGWLGTGAGWVFAAMALGWGGWSHVPEDLKPSLIDEAEEVAKAILWLLSDEASYTTGTTIDVTGGRGIQP